LTSFHKAAKSVFPSPYERANLGMVSWRSTDYEHQAI